MDGGIPKLKIEHESSGSEIIISDKPPCFAYYVTGHGLGHATRVVEVCRHLILYGCTVHVVTAAPDFVFYEQICSDRLHIRKKLLDSGAVQADAFTVNQTASLETYHDVVVKHRTELLQEERDWLVASGVDVVVSDVVPLACAAAAKAGIPAVCVTNFSWDFIYSEYIRTAGSIHRATVLQIAEDYSQAMLFRLPGYVPMPAFRDVMDVPLVVRKNRRSREEMRALLGIKDDEKLLLLNFGGQVIPEWRVEESFLPPGWKCVLCTPKQEFAEMPPNFLWPQDPELRYIPDLMVACDCLLGKIGYGTSSEVLAYRVPFVFVRRDYFNEEPFLRKMIEIAKGAVEMHRRDFMNGAWGPYLMRALRTTPSYDKPLNGGEVVAQKLIAVATGKLQVKGGGKARLKDAVVLGYYLQQCTSRGGDLGIPDWYLRDNHAESLATSPIQRLLAESGQGAAATLSPTNGELALPQFDILEGSVQGYPDTQEFLADLGAIGDHGPPPTNLPDERRAAWGLFNWEEPIVVTRAPGRLDVMGGIADYSGSHVLQLPIKEACHVALQRQAAAHPDRLWKHVQQRHKNNGTTGKVPVLRIVSYGSDITNRGPTFDMDLTDLMDKTTGKPISYEQANKYFRKDLSRSWAAYVAGALVVLMREKGLRFEESISILVSSNVPEGMGVSSSAAVEVATMKALVEAYEVKLDPYELAVLCQKAENFVVGAPCGIMDQMTSAYGQKNKLLYLVCQPAEVLGFVTIPSAIVFWGIDSGIRHSVGGADYGSVRVATFMGKKIISSLAALPLLPGGETSAHPGADASNMVAASPYSPYTTEDQAPFRRAKDADLGLPMSHLVNLPPHRFELIYAPHLPEAMTGAEFERLYGSHGDGHVTSISSGTVYRIRRCTGHPVHENFRVKAFASLMRNLSSESQMELLGELMFQVRRCLEPWYTILIG
eukprot:jgi/Mesvir1/13697/Mv02130-RA.2